jgi:hypothetical protein
MEPEDTLPHSQVPPPVPIHSLLQKNMHSLSDPGILVLGLKRIFFFFKQTKNPGVNVTMVKQLHSVHVRQ